MKFTDGYWGYRPGYDPHCAVQVHEVEPGRDSLTVYAATKQLNNRGDTLNLPMLTLRLSSPMANIIRVQLVHHKGGAVHGPAFELKPQNRPDIDACPFSQSYLAISAVCRYCSRSYRSTC